MNAIIFGANGQDGYYLSRLLKEKGVKVIPISRKNPAIIGDVVESCFVSNQIKFHRPDYIFHFAANSSTNHNALFENHETISTGTLNILESVRKYSPESRVFLTGSALQFMNDGSPISEQTPFEAKNPYAIARIQSVYAARYFRSLGVKTYVGYFFHHDSPRRSTKHINMFIVKAVADIKKGIKEYVEIGDPTVIKEFNHAADFMRGVWTLVNQEYVFEAVVGSGKGHTLTEWIDTCFDFAGLVSTGRINIKDDYRSDFSSLVSNPALINKTGWYPEFDMKYLAKAMLNTVLNNLNE